MMLMQVEKVRVRARSAPDGGWRHAAGRREGHPRRRWPRQALRWALAGIAVAMVVRMGGLGRDEITGALALAADLDPRLLGVVLALEVGWAVTLASIQRSALLAVGGDVGTRQALRISMAGFTLSRVVPGGGAAGGVFAMRELVRLGHAPGVAATAMVASWATSTTSLALLMAGGLAVVVAGGDRVTGAGAALGALAALALGGGLILRAVCHAGARRRLFALAARVVARTPWRPDLHGLHTALDGDGDGGGAARGRARHLSRSAAWAAAAWLCDAAALWLVFAACGYRLSLPLLLVGYGSANLLNSLPELTPGWLGVFETALSATYISLGVPADTALAAVLLYRLASFWLPVAAGAAPLVRSLTTARRDPAAASLRRAPAIALSVPSVAAVRR